MYKKLHSAHTNHPVTFDDGGSSTRYCRYEKGVVSGEYRDIQALIADEGGFDGLGFDPSVGSNDDSWRVLNIFKNGGRYVDTVAIAGAMDDDHALTIADTQFDHLGGDYSVVVALDADHQFDSLNNQGDVWSIDAIQKLASNPSQDKHYLPVITAQELAVEATRATFDSVAWDGESLSSHGGDDGRLYIDLVKTDTFNDLVGEFNLRDELANIGAETTSFDSLMDTNNRLPLLKDRLFKAMVRAGSGEVQVTNVTQTKPFKRQGVSNVAFVFDLSDGQKLSIWFHNPDSTPTKLMPSDIMISWKWLLNKRDVTAVLSPKNGDNVQLPMLASRIMRLANKNSKRFKRTQASRLKTEAELQKAQESVVTKTAVIEQLDKDIASLQSQIDQVLVTAKEKAEAAAKAANEGAASAVSGSEQENAEPENSEDPNDDLFTQDVTQLSDEDLEALYKKVDIATKKATAWSKNMNALQNEGGEGIYYGQENEDRFMTRLSEVMKERAKRKNDKTFTPEFIVKLMKDYWYDILFVNEKTPFEDVAERNKVNPYDAKRRIELSKNNPAMLEAIRKHVASEMIAYRDKARAQKGPSGLPQALASLIAQFGGYKPSDDKKLLAITNEVIAGAKELVDVVPEDKKKYVLEADTPEPQKESEWLKGFTPEKRAAIESLFPEVNMDTKTDEILAMMLLIHNHAEEAMTPEDHGNLVGAAARLFDRKELNRYYLKGGTGDLSDAAVAAYNKALNFLDAEKMKSKEFVNFIFSQDIKQGPEPAAPWWQSVDEGVSVYLIGGSTGRDYVEISENGNAYDVAVAYGGKDPVEARRPLSAKDACRYVAATINKIVGGSRSFQEIYESLKLVNGADVLNQDATSRSQPKADEDSAQPESEVVVDADEVAAEPETTESATESAYSQEDIDYLQSIISGTTSADDVDMDKVIEIGEKDENDPLFNEALEVVLAAVDAESANL